MAKKSYPVLSKILHDGQEYGPAEKLKTIALTEDDAEALVLAGVLGEAVALDLSGATNEERAAAILEFVLTLTMADFTAAGGLRAEARRRAITALGFEPNEEEIRVASLAHAKKVAAEG